MTGILLNLRDENSPTGSPKKKKKQQQQQQQQKER